jgi:hypothetical protein
MFNQPNRKEGPYRKIFVRKIFIFSYCEGREISKGRWDFATGLIPIGPLTNPEFKDLQLVLDSIFWASGTDIASIFS